MKDKLEARVTLLEKRVDYFYENYANKKEEIKDVCVENKPKVYISGPITGRGLTECKVDFNSTELWLTGLGYDAINPMSYDTIEDGTWEDYMKRDLKLLMDCDYIYMLNGWEKSKGARMEIYIATELGIKILLLDENGKVIDS